MLKKSKMSGSFFDFSSIEEQGIDDMDEKDYDALNGETFGHMDDDLPNANWEEMHEQLALELENHSTEFGGPNDELGDRLASLTMNCIFDDDREDSSTCDQGTLHPTPFKNVKSVPPSSNWTNRIGAQNNLRACQLNSGPQNAKNGDSWEESPSISYSSTHHAKMPIKIPTVSEIESKLPLLSRNKTSSADGMSPINFRLESPAQQAHGPNPAQQAHGPNPAQQAHGPSPAHGPAKDLDVRMINHQQNGSFAGARGGAIPRRPRPDSGHHPHFAQHFNNPNMPQIRRPVVHQGQMYNQRNFENRMTQHAQRLMRQPHFRPNNQPYYYNQHQHYGRVALPQQMDDYAGLMNPQEKQWLASIQMMQLNTHQPFQDDYYFTVYQQRHGSVSRKAIGAHCQKRDHPPQKPSTTYKPLQFENSLGKLQIGSVTAPRKIIDMVLVEGLDHNTKQIDKKSKAVLLEIEQMFNVMLKIEDAFNPANNEAGEVDIVALQEKLLNMIIPEGNEEKLVQIMAIRKGKKLVLRMLPNLLFPSKLLQPLMKELPSITRKDTEHNMLLFLPSIRNYLQTIDLHTLVEITTGYDNRFLLSNKFTVSVVANLIERADQVREDCTDDKVLNEWNNFLIRLLEATRKSSETERPVIAVDRNILIRHLTPVTDQVTPVDVAALLLTLQPASVDSGTQPIPDTQI